MLIEQQIDTLIRKFLKKKEYVEFLVGRDGEFDQIVSSTIRRCKRTIRDDNSAHVWVLPYPTADFRDNEDAYWDYYDEKEIYATSAVGHFKGAYQIRNSEMADRADLIVFCIQRVSGCTWQTMKSAKKQNIPYINLNDPLEEAL